ncbi:F151B protein, partial [Dryoscopus gambensis]|nr:F151B protein [Dryoscopus gambensis]
PILAHPPDTDSDITLQEWLAEMVSTNKGIKLDFKSKGSKGFHHKFVFHVDTAFIAFFPRGVFCPEPRGSDAIFGSPGRAVLVCGRAPEPSLGWVGAVWGSEHRVLSPGYAWAAVQEMSRLCHPLSQPVTFAVRAALLPGSVPQLQWLMQQSHRYTLTVWTGKEDVYSVEDLLFIRENFDKSRVYYDIFEPQNSEFKQAIGI